MARRGTVYAGGLFTGEIVEELGLLRGATYCDEGDAAAAAVVVAVGCGLHVMDPSLVS